MCLRRDSIRNLVCNASASCSRSKYHNADLVQLDIADMQGRRHCCQCDTTRALDIIVEAGNLRLILVQDFSCILETKILAVYVRFKALQLMKSNLQVDVSLWETVPRSLDKVVHKLIVFFPSCTGLSQAQIKVIIEKLLVLCNRN